MHRIWQHFASVDGAYGSNLLAYSEHAVAKPCKNLFRCLKKSGITIWSCLAQTAHAVALCQRMRRMQLQIASIDGAYGSNLLAYAAHVVAICQRRWCIRQQFASVDSTYGSKLLAYAVHAVAICQRRRRMQQLKKNGQYLTHL